jgi:Ca2+-binding EF-hand superfamily protein
LKRVAKELNKAISDEKLMEIITRANLDRDGAVGFE